MFQHLLRRVRQLFGFESNLNRRDRLPRRTRLQLEALEDRTVPTLTLSPVTLNLPAGSTLFGSIATLTDSSGNTIPFYYTSTLNFGDGSGNTSATFSYSSGVFQVTGLHTYFDPGEYTLSLSVTNTLDSDTTSFTEPVNVTNPVSISSISNQTSTEGSSVSLYVSASDPTSATLAYSAQGLPPGLAINSSTGAITGTVAKGAAQNGPYSPTVTATDGASTASRSFTWTVNSPASITSPGTQTSTEGGSVSLSLSASDSSGGTLAYSATGLPAGLKINSSTGAITGTAAVGAAANGPYTVTVTGNDGTYSTSQTFLWTISSPLTMAPVVDQTSTEGGTVSLSISTTYSGGGTLAYTAAGLPPGLAINTSSGAITGTVAAGAADFGPYSVTVTAGDGTYSASQTFPWNVNSPITITTPADQTNTEGDTVSLSLSASDSSGGTLTYGATGLPAGLSINASTGAITGTVATGAAANGPYTVTLLAGDGTYSNTTTVTWNVANPIVVTTPSDQTNTEGDTVSLTISASYSGGSLTYSATGLPNGLSINSSTGAITGTLSAGGSFTPTVTATHSSTSASVTFNWTVGSPITITDPGDQPYNAADAVFLQMAASDTASGTLSFSESGLPTGLSINSSTGAITGTISSSLGAGVYTSTVTVTDGTNTAVDSFPWTISASGVLVVTNPGAQSSTEGSSVSLTVGKSYSGSGTLSWAAEGLPPGLRINPSTGAITGTVAAGDSTLSPYSVTVTATDGTATDSQYFLWNVASPITLTNPGTQSSTEGSTVSLSISASYSGGSLTYSADGLPDGLKINASTGSITGTIAARAAANGPYSVTVQAASGAYVADQTFTWNIASPITLTNPGDQTSTEGATISSLSLSATDSSSGTLKYSALGLPTGLKINTSSGAITGTVAVGTAAYGPYSVTVIAQDGTYSTSQTFTWTVNSPVTITTPAEQTSTEGGSVSLSLSASDSVSGSTLTYAAFGLPLGLKINPSTGAITGTVTAGDAANGPYEVTVLAEDGTYSASTVFTWNVNSPVVITVPADQTNNQGDSVSLSITVTNSAGGTLSYSATGLPSGLSINSSTGAITGTVSNGGYWEPTITATNGTYSDTEEFDWTVNSAVSITDPGYQVNNIGNTVSLQITAADSSSGTLSYSATGLPTGLSISSSTGLISGTVGSTASVTTPYTTTVTVGDGTHAAVDTFTWNILQAGPVVVTFPGNQTNTAGDEVALPVNVTTTAGETLLYTVSGLPSGLFINPNTGMILGTIAYSASSGSPYSVTITAGDGTYSASQTLSWTVNAAGTVRLANPGDQFGNEGDTVSVSLSATDSSSGTLSYAAFGLPAGLKINPSTGAITGTVALGDSFNAPYIVTVTANDGTYSATQTFAWYLNDPVTITTPVDQTNNEGDSVSLSVSAADSSSGTLSYAALGLPPGLKINPSTGAITGTVAVQDATDGPYSVTVIAADGTYSASTTFNWNISTTITVATPDTQSNNDGDSVSLTVGAYDTPSATLTFSVQGLPPGLSMNPSTGAITGTMAVGDSGIGTFEPTLLVTDGTYTAISSFEWDVAGPISIAGPGDQANIVGDTVTLPISASDSSGTPSFAAIGLPAGLSINTSTGAITGTVGSSAASIGDYSTTVTVSDGTNTASDTFGWTIGAASSTLTLATPSNQSTAENASASLSLSTTYSGAGTVHYFAENLPPGLKINPSTGAVSGTVAVGDAAYGPYTVTVIATDGTISATEKFTWSISSPLTITQPADQTSTEGASVSLSLSDSDTSGGTPKFTAVGLPPGLSISTSTGAISGTVALDAAALGPYTVTVTAGDGTYSASQTFTWTVNGPLTLTGVADRTNYEGATPTLTISATDSSGGTVKFSATGLPAGLYINQSTGAIGGTIAIGASFFGPYTVTVTANDGTYSASTTFNWTVNNPISIVAQGVQDYVTGAAVSLAVAATDVFAGTLSYAAHNLPPGLSINSSTGLISGTISNAIAAVGNFASSIVVTAGSYSNLLTINWFSLGSGLTTVLATGDPPPNDTTGSTIKPDSLKLDPNTMFKDTVKFTGNDKQEVTGFVLADRAQAVDYAMGPQYHNLIAIQFRTSASSDAYTPSMLHVLQFEWAVAKKGGKPQEGNIVEGPDSDLRLPYSLSDKQPDWFVDAYLKNYPYVDDNPNWLGYKVSNHVPTKDENYTSTLIFFDAPGPQWASVVGAKAQAPWLNGDTYDTVSYHFVTFLVYRGRPIYAVTWERDFTWNSTTNVWDSDYAVTGHAAVKYLQDALDDKAVIGQDQLPGVYLGGSTKRLVEKNPVHEEYRTTPP